MVWIVNETIWIWQVETGVFSVAWSRRRRRNISVAERRELKQKWKTTIINTILSCAFHYRNDNNKLRNTCRLSCENVVCQCNKSKPSISIQSLLSMHVSLHCEDRMKNNKKNINIEFTRMDLDLVCHWIDLPKPVLVLWMAAAAPVVRSARLALLARYLYSNRLVCIALVSPALTSISIPRDHAVQ